MPTQKRLKKIEEKAIRFGYTVKIFSDCSGSLLSTTCVYFKKKKKVLSGLLKLDVTILRV